MKELAKQLCLAMCELYSDSLDRMKLWDRIPSALVTSAAKCDDGDTDRFVSMCMDHVKADTGECARNKLLSNLVMTLDARDDAYRQAFVRHCGSKSPIVAIHARAAWEQRKLANANGGAA